MVTIWTPDLGPFQGPKYLRLADAIAQAIAGGELAAGTKLPPQRLLADKLGVTVGTVTRAYDEAQRRGQLEARVGSGTFVKGQALALAPASGEALALDGAMAPLGPQARMLSEGLTALAQDAEALHRCLPYPQANGLPAQRQRFLAWLAGQGFALEDSQLLLNHGGQHGIHIALQALCEAGDTVLCEGLSFPGIKFACQEQGLKLVGLAMDDQGLLPEALEAACKQYRPRAIYLTPNLQNPSCATLPLERRQAILALCRQYDLWVLEDDVQFMDPAAKPQALFQLDPERVVFLSSFSKRYAGTVRLGFMLFPARLRSRMDLGLRASTWTVSPLVLELVSRWLAGGQMDALEQWLAGEMRARRQLADQLLPGLQGEASGFNCWLALPEPWRASDFSRAAMERGVRIRVAEDYAIGRLPAPQAVRLSISQPGSRQELTLALGILHQLLLEGPHLARAVL
ncbi:PLP-dependent aminotransferase family protein [Gallaecimonas kandeliae]|uniref:aminotransferase-like domain-containing protein n=1 Tax=Gallaecimonas kandeliae TaxID=3029055 RepID=UPI002647B58E|nr:PLP-dependent aminotransferase family protein [Gallaecimonas kandeliae]WKE65100.1 PLP-dependent aminotransferase family protein [Gallaecimonas kandeliae]